MQQNALYFLHFFVTTQPSLQSYRERKRKPKETKIESGDCRSRASLRTKSCITYTLLLARALRLSLPSKCQHHFNLPNHSLSYFRLCRMIHFDIPTSCSSATGLELWYLSSISSHSAQGQVKRAPRRSCRASFIAVIISVIPLIKVSAVLKTDSEFGWILEFPLIRPLLNITYNVRKQIYDTTVFLWQSLKTRVTSSHQDDYARIRLLFH